MVSGYKNYLLLIILTFLITDLSARRTGDYCLFEESLKQQFRNLKCHPTNIDQCATKARKIAQESLSGSWGAIMVANKKLMLEQKVDWYVHALNPYPGRCRLIINDTILLELFRADYRKSNLSQNNHWLWQAFRSLSPDELHGHEVCPHSALRELISSFSIKTNLRHQNEAPKIHVMAKSLAQAFQDETGQQWNVFITRNITQEDNRQIGVNFPHFVYDARAGICFGHTLDGYRVNASIIGFEDQHQEETSNG